MTRKYRIKKITYPNQDKVYYVAEYAFEWGGRVKHWNTLFTFKDFDVEKRNGVAARWASVKQHMLDTLEEAEQLILDDIEEYKRYELTEEIVKEY